MNELPKMEEIPALGQARVHWLKIIKFPVALFAAALAPVIAFVPLAGLILSVAALFNVITTNNFNGEAFLSVTFGAMFLAFYTGFYVPCLSFPCVVVFGIPLSIIASRLDFIHKWNCVFAGFFLGSVPGGLFFYSTYSNGSSFANGVHFWVNGVPTLAGLIELTVLILLSGILGIVGGYSFWFIWEAFSRHEVRNSAIS